jgi:hypothetical protein
MRTVNVDASSVEVLSVVINTNTDRLTQGSDDLGTSGFEYSIRLSYPPHSPTQRSVFAFSVSDGLRPRAHAALFPLQSSTPSELISKRIFKSISHQFKPGQSLGQLTPTNFSSTLSCNHDMGNWPPPSAFPPPLFISHFISVR